MIGITMNQRHVDRVSPCGYHILKDITIFGAGAKISTHYRQTGAFPAEPKTGLVRDENRGAGAAEARLGGRVGMTGVAAMADDVRLLARAGLVRLEKSVLLGLARCGASLIVDEALAFGDPEM